MRAQLKSAIVLLVVLTVLTGFLYPLAVTGLALLFFPGQARGSLIIRGGKVIGSQLIGQPFSGRQYFHPRPSAAGDAGYDPLASGGSNLGPLSRQLTERILKSAAELQADNPGVRVPLDLVTASGSGLDPDLSPAAADFQAPRVAAARGWPLSAVRALILRHTEGRQFNLLGEPRVNVLRLNLDLDTIGSAGITAPQQTPQ